jgi:hypothetical protein
LVAADELLYQEGRCGGKQARPLVWLEGRNSGNWVSIVKPRKEVTVMRNLDDKDESVLEKRMVYFFYIIPNS